MKGTSSTHTEIRNSYKFLVEKPKGKRPLGRRKWRQKDNIKINLREIGLNCIEVPWHRAQWRKAFVNMVMNLRVI
jgi:hypothetical protein